MIKKIVLLCIALSFIPSIIFSQTPKDTLVASQYYKKADSLYSLRKLDNSIIFFRKSLTQYQKAEVWGKVVDCYNKIALSQLYLYDLEKSFKNSNKALEISAMYLPEENKEKADAFDNLGMYYEGVSDFYKALFHYKKALNIRQKVLPKDHALFAYSYGNIGIVYQQIGEYKKSINYQQKALAVKIKLFGPNYRKIGVNYNNIAAAYNDLGIYDKAIEFYEKDLAVTKNGYGEDHLFMAYSYSNIAVVYGSIRQYDKALKYYKSALKIFKKKNELTFSASTYLNIGKLYSNTGNDKEALQYYEKALPTLIESYGEKHINVITLFKNIGVSYENIGEFTKSLSYHKKALSISLNTLGKNHPVTFDSFFNLGRHYVSKEEYEKGLEYYDKCLASLNKNSGNQKLHIAKTHNGIAEIYALRKEFKKSLFYFEKALLANYKLNIKPKKSNSGYAINEYIDANVLLQTLASKAKTLLAFYKNDKNIEDLIASGLMFQKTDSVVSQIRQSLYTQNDKVRFSKNTKTIYNEAIETEFLLHEIKQSHRSLEQAFYYAEKSKANTLKELLTESNAKNFAGLPKELLELERRLKNKHVFYQSKISEKWSSETLDTTANSPFESKIFDISRSYDSLIRVLEEKHPKYYQLKHQSHIVSVKEVQRNLEENSTVIEFFIAESIAYVFIVSKSNFMMKRIVTNDLEGDIEKLRNAIIINNIKEYKNIAHNLYKNLIHPIKDLIVGDELIIIPDGALWHLNFDLLLTQNNEVATRDMPYLLRDYAISYANSTNLLFNPFEGKFDSSGISNECLAFSFSDSTELINTKTMSLTTLRDAGDDLPGTREEIKAISNIVNGQYFYGSEAVETNFKQNASRYSILHLALHGDVDHKNPQNSRLYFTKSKDTIEDNLLYSHELFALDIPAELAVLSACNTGTGAIAKGEGIMSLGNAFQYAGTKSLLLSGWEVSDKSAPVLIENFYKNMASGMNKAKALQQAKLNFIKTTDFEQVAPFYWGNFYLLGTADPIDIDQPLGINIYWIVLVFIIIILALIFVYYKKRSTR